MVWFSQRQREAQRQSQKEWEDLQATQTRLVEQRIQEIENQKRDEARRLAEENKKLAELAKMRYTTLVDLNEGRNAQSSIIGMRTQDKKPSKMYQPMIFSTSSTRPRGDPVV